jgi:c-di-GMP-binding flagellar brake protein YcgR
MTAGAMADSPESTSEYQGQTEKITHPPQIAGLLRRILDNRVLLRVQVPGHPGIFNSLLLQVNTDQKFIILDELNPTAGHRFAQQTGRLQVHCQSQGVEIGFACDIETRSDASGVSYYRAPLPALLHYLQRRMNYRVRVVLDKDIPVYLQLDADTEVEGQLFDLSLGGMGFNLASDIRLERGQVLERCTIRPPAGDPLRVQLEIRFVQTDERRPTQRIGARFVSLGPQQENALRRFVTHLEREVLRRKARR